MELEQIKKLIEKPLNRAAIMNGISHGMRLKFHSDSCVVPLSVDSYMSSFLSWIGGTTYEGNTIGGLLPADKFETFKQLITYPLPTSELTESITKNLKRVFEGKNAIEHYNFEDKAIEAEFKDYFKSRKFKELAFEAMTSDIDSVIIVDLPKMKESGKAFPEPYYYILPISRIIDISVFKDDDIEYIIFKDGEGKTICIDEEFWTVLVGESVDKLYVESQVRHELPHAPARMLWTDKLGSSNKINHKSPITNSLGELDWLLFHKISKRHLDLYASYPVTIAYKIKANSDKDKPQTGKALRGAGSVLTIPPPQSKDDPDLMANPMKVIPAERQSLDYNVSEDQRLEERIFKSCVGADGEASNDQAKNMKQIQAGFESKKDILTGVKINFENAQKWLADTIGILRYREAYKGSELNYGNEWYLQDEDEVLNCLQTAKTSQSPEAVISDLTDKYFDTKYRGDSETKERVQILMNIDPFPTKAVSEVIALFTSGLVDRETILIKINLDAFTKRFERENNPITEFGESMEFYKKIEVITNKFKEYAKEISSEKQPIDSQQKPEIPNRPIDSGNGSRSHSGTEVDG